MTHSERKLQHFPVEVFWNLSIHPLSFRDNLFLSFPRIFIFKKREENLSYILKQAYYPEQIRQTTQENQSAEQNDENI